jgi:sulfonate transport system substrate-binding protein
MDGKRGEKMRKALMTIMVALAVALASGNARSEPVKIRVGWVVTPSELAAVIFPRKDLARHNGLTYQVETVHFQSTAPMITALATGELELAPLAFSTFATAVQNARLTDLRIIADELQDGTGDTYSSQYLVLKDSPIKSVEDLKGKVLASIGAGSGLDMAMRNMMGKHGLIDKRDYTVVETAFPNMKAMLLEKKVALIMLPPAFAWDPAITDSARILFTMKDAMGGPSQLTMWTARAAFIEKNRAVLVDVLEDMVRGVRWYFNPANREAAVTELAAFSKQPRENLDRWVLTKRDQYHDLNGMPDVEAIQRNIDTQRELGLLKAPIKVGSHVDLGIVREAVQRLP